MCFGQETDIGSECLHQLRALRIFGKNGLRSSEKRASHSSNLNTADNRQLILASATRSLTRIFVAQHYACCTSMSSVVTLNKTRDFNFHGDEDS
jgi:hypothetical protein